MTDPAQPSHTPEPAAGHAPAPPSAPPFAADEWQILRRSDKTAATYIVGLMGGIFAIGLVLYLIVLYSVAA
jgi:hypothetical protein